jgi:hypothetical protein
MAPWKRMPSFVKNTLLVTESAIGDLMIDDEFVVIYVDRNGHENNYIGGRNYRIVEIDVDD